MAKKNINEVTIPINPNEEQIKDINLQCNIYNITYNYSLDYVMKQNIHNLRSVMKWTLEDIAQYIFKTTLTEKNPLYSFLVSKMHLPVIHGAIRDLSEQLILFMNNKIFSIPEKLNSYPIQMYSIWINLNLQDYPNLLPQIIIPGLGTVDLNTKINIKSMSKIIYMKIVHDVGRDLYFLTFGVQYSSADSDYMSIENFNEAIGVYLNQNTFPPKITLSNSRYIPVGGKITRLIHHLDSLVRRYYDEPNNEDRKFIDQDISDVGMNLDNLMNMWYEFIAHDLLDTYETIIIEQYPNLPKTISPINKPNVIITLPSFDYINTLLTRFNESMKKNIIIIPQNQIYLQTCSVCKQHNLQTNTFLTQWMCPYCGSLLYTDINAARNILDAGLKYMQNMQGYYSC